MVTHIWIELPPFNNPVDATFDKPGGGGYTYVEH
jgi:hypothetical protein